MNVMRYRIRYMLSVLLMRIAKVLLRIVVVLQERLGRGPRFISIRRTAGYLSTNRLFLLVHFVAASGCCGLKLLVSHKTIRQRRRRRRHAVLPRSLLHYLLCFGIL